MRRAASARQCRHRVVDDDHGTTRDVGRLGGTVGALAAFELGELALADRRNVSSPQAELAEQSVVVDGHVAGRDGADRELRIEGRSELAYHERRQTTGDTYVERASE